MKQETENDIEENKFTYAISPHKIHERSIGNPQDKSITEMMKIILFGFYFNNANNVLLKLLDYNKCVYSNQLNLFISVALGSLIFGVS